MKYTKPSELLERDILIDAAIKIVNDLIFEKVEICCDLMVSCDCVADLAKLEATLKQLKSEEISLPGATAAIR